MQKKDIERSLFCLEKLELVRAINSGSKTYFVPFEMQDIKYLSFPRAIDTARLSMNLAQYYSHQSHFARKSAIQNSMGAQA